MNNNQEERKWSENLILVDADYIDRVAFDLSVNFERMLGRQIPKADMAMWADYVALDGGIRPGKNLIQVLLVHRKSKVRMDNFEPSDFDKELTDMGFNDGIGDFVFGAYATEEDIVTHGDYFVDILRLMMTQKEVKRLIVVPNGEDDNIIYKVREALNRLDDDTKRVTLLTMVSVPGGAYRQDSLGFSLMAALGIRSEEINNVMD
jgi:hypothetical protein